MRRAKVFSASAKRFCLGKRPRTQHSQQKRETVLRSEMPPSSACPAKVQRGFARDTATSESISSKGAKRLCIGQCATRHHSQPKREAVLRSEMPPSSACPAKVQSGLARNNATSESISSKGANRLCIGQCARRHHSQPKCEAVLRKKTRDNKQTELF